MMRRALVAGILAAALGTGVSSAHDAAAASTSPSEETRRILDSVQARRGTLSQADREAARKLNVDGDRHYKRHRYDAAFTAYANSYPNYPTAHAYLMAGDAHWRAVAAHHASLQGKAATDGTRCTLDNSHFAHDLSMDLAQHQDVGLALAVEDGDERFLASTLYRRSRQSAACLHSLAHDYESEPPSTCIDIAKLQSCLGAPLIP
jgi:hypothetical protein